MREIKFRAWDGQRMRDWDEVAGLGAGDLSNGFYDAVMQFTGLLDKNGKEIYEGDIVRVGSKAPIEVRWHQDSAGFLSIGMELMSNTEIIGDIYRNPDFLEI